jgi:EAL domain-containing protein (putative c-di-GMP-specific phosphodiesterase class I)/GGDEF domain-containing protein
LLIFGIALFGCFGQIRNSLQQQLMSSIEGVAEQNEILVEKEAGTRFRLLDSLARELSDGDESIFVDKMQGFVETYQFKRMGYIAADGTAKTTDGYRLNMSDRDFFQQSMQGKNFLTDAFEDRIDTSYETINVFSVPVYEKNQKTIKGVLFGTCGYEMFEECLKNEIFEGQAFNYIIKIDGTIVAGSGNSKKWGIGKNIFVTDASEDERDDDARDDDARDKMISDMKEGKSGYGMDPKRKEASLYYYMPLKIEESGETWYVVTAVSESVLTSRMQVVMDAINSLMVIILAVISVSVGVYIYSWRKSKKELMTLAYQDPVTLGDNFVAFKERAKSKKDGVGWLIAMDVTDFKLINSTCGVKKGDEVLRVIWEIFETETGENELAAHVNADRFILFWMDENQENIKQRLEYVIRKIEEIPERLEIPNLFPVFGIFHTIVLDEIDPLYGNAVQAKHQIKGRRDRHYIFYDELNHESIQENRELEEHFETALENEEFEIWYQPKYSAHSRKLVGAEALVRWRRADGALIPPLKFIPLFERNGNIIRLDEYVFRAVCRQQKEWQKQGQKMLPVSVNISRVSLYYSSVVEKYESIIRSFDLDSKYIQLEITESATIDNNEIFNLLEQFHTAGFKILLDDFGSGYSSLAALNRMHFDTIKLDKSLVDYIGDDNGEKLLNSITRLAQSFGMEITAEGVETVEQLMFLCNLDCDDIQGYYFSRPLPVKEYEECLKEACM